MHDFDGACKQFREAFLDSIDFITQSGTPRWWSAAQLTAAAVDALGGAHLPPNGETSGATFQAFVKKRFRQCSSHSPRRCRRCYCCFLPTPE
jgi:hypothetical protein